MAKLLDNGQKVKYLHQGKWLKGLIHAVKTHEEPNGIVTRVAYLIDTGNTVREDVGLNAKTGKEEIVRQPEQVEIDQNFVKLA